MRRMPCRPWSLLLTMALLWQGLTLSGLGAWFAPAEVARHAFQHWQGAAPHHHHADGRPHQDHSGASLQHALDDAALQAPVLPAQAPPLPLALASQPLRAPELPDWASPTLGTLERPPRPA